MNSKPQKVPWHERPKVMLAFALLLVAFLLGAAVGHKQRVKLDQPKVSETTTLLCSALKTVQLYIPDKKYNCSSKPKK